MLYEAIVLNYHSIVFDQDRVRTDGGAQVPHPGQQRRDQADPDEGDGDYQVGGLGKGCPIIPAKKMSKSIW